MAEAGRMVRVTGLPPDVDNNRLKDKLLIHFLRARNEGGEIDSISIAAASQSALITFEDASVAQRVVEHKQHTLEVDGKKYKLTATTHQQHLDPDQVVLRLSATVTYSRLPGGVEALTSLRKSHRKVKIDYAVSERCCELSGSYSDVQAALTQLLGEAGGPEPAESDDPSRRAAPGDPSDRANKRRADNADKSLNEESSRSKKNQEANANAAPEDFSLILDADMFQYLQKCCREEYRRILSRHGVEVVNETTQGLTTLFLQLTDARVEDGQERLRLARTAISRLYQENEAEICRDQLPKLILSLRGGLRRAMDTLSTRFPKLLLNEDEHTVYIIGNTRDVSEAKRALLLDEVEASDKKEDVASLLKFPSYNLGSSPRADEEGVTVTPPFALDEGVDETLKSEDGDLRGTKYKLAARFKDSGLGGLGSRPADFTFRPNLSPSRPTRHGPVLGHDVMSETPGTPAEAVSRAQNTGGDILFKPTYNYKPSPSLSAQVKSFLNTTETQFKSLPPAFITTPYRSPEGTTRPPVGSGSTLKQASSFSGTPQQKAQVVSPKSRDDSAIRTAEGSPSFSSPAVKDKQEVHNAEITVSKLIWRYIQEVFSTRVADLTGEVQMNESSEGGSRELKVLLSGADSSKVRLCRERLEKLVASVSADFTVKELSWPELGVPDSENETLLACCVEVQNRFKKIAVHRSKKALYLVGPEEMCSQVAATLREVFSGDHEHHVLSSLSTFTWDLDASLQPSEPRSAHLNKSELALGTQTNTTDNQQWRKTYRGEFLKFNDDDLYGTSSEGKRPLHRSATQKDTRQPTEPRSAHLNKSQLALGTQTDTTDDQQWKTTYRGEFLKFNDDDLYGTSSEEKRPLHRSATQKDTRQPTEPRSAHLNKSQLALGTQTDTTDDQQWKTTYRGEFLKFNDDDLYGTSPGREDHFVKTTGTTEEERAVHRSVTEKDTSPVNGDLSADKERTLQTTQTGRRDTETQNAPDKSRSDQEGQAYRCACGEYGTPPASSKCGVKMCSKCLETRHAHCRVCSGSEQTPRGIRGEIKKSKLNLSLQGHKDGVIKISYRIPDGVQGEGHPSPGKPFKGGTFEAFLPDSDKARKLLPRLEKAFRRGLTFTVAGKGAEAKVTWNIIPHKTSLQGGKAQNGYPDSRYLTRLSDILSNHGID